MPTMLCSCASNACQVQEITQSCSGFLFVICTCSHVVLAVQVPSILFERFLMDARSLQAICRLPRCALIAWGVLPCGVLAERSICSRLHISACRAALDVSVQCPRDLPEPGRACHQQGCILCAGRLHALLFHLHACTFFVLMCFLACTRAEPGP